MCWCASLPVAVAVHTVLHAYATSPWCRLAVPDEKHCVLTQLLTISPVPIAEVLHVVRRQRAQPDDQSSSQLQGKRNIRTAVQMPMNNCIRCTAAQAGFFALLMLQAC